MKNRNILNLFVFAFFSVGSSVVTATPNNNNGNSFQFAVLGDTNYGSQSVGSSIQLIENQLNKDSSLQFVVHVGDETLNISGCTNANYDYYIGDIFNRSVHPLIYTPGDNEWTDCNQHPIFNPGSPTRDPLEGLAYIRAHFFPNRASDSNGNGTLNSQGVSLGQKTLTLTRQSKDGDNPNTSFDESKFVENQRWEHAGIMFVTINTAGSRDNCVVNAPASTLPSYTPSQLGNLTNVPQSCSEEKREREAANIAWLKESFAIAKKTQKKGMMILTQVDVRFNLDNNDGTCKTGLSTGDKATCEVYKNYRLAMRDIALNWNKPVAYVHGDQHNFVIQKPLTDAPNFTRIMTFGSPDTGWIKFTVAPNNPDLFSVACGGIVQVDGSGNYVGSTCRAPVLLTPGQ